MVQTFLLSSDDPYEVLLANSGAEALELARREIPDLVLLDLMMPEMDGIEVCVQLRASRSTYLIPVIMLTASALHDHPKSMRFVIRMSLKLVFRAETEHVLLQVRSTH